MLTHIKLIWSNYTRFRKESEEPSFIKKKTESAREIILTCMKYIVHELFKEFFKS